MAEAINVLQMVGRRFGHEFDLHYDSVGGEAIDRFGVALKPETLRMCRKCHAVQLGAVGGPQWDDPQAKVHPEDGLLALRKGLGLFANSEVIKGVDLMVVRELTGGLYFGKPKKRWLTPRGRRAVDTMAYSEAEIERILRVGFELARSRRRKLASVDKANILETSRLWRQIADELSAGYPDVELWHLLVDACAMRLIQRPADFDVIVTENTFGDILTDEASMLAGSMGMLPSASLAGIHRGDRGPGKGEKGMYEPIHGSAPSRAGRDLPNPIAAILCVAMMLRYSFGLAAEAEAIEQVVADVLEQGHRTYDIMEPGKKQVGTREMGGLIAEGLGIGY
jgi:3-isopropylmalate dehydrogenase